MSSFASEEINANMIWSVLAGRSVEGEYVSKISELREKKGLTQLEVANFLGVDPSTIRNLEKGRSGLESIVRVSKLCEILECEAKDLWEEVPIDEY